MTPTSPDTCGYIWRGWPYVAGTTCTGPASRARCARRGVRMNLTLGETLRTLRERQGMTQEELAEKARLSRATVSAVENDAANVTLGTLISVAEALGRTLRIDLVKR